VASRAKELRFETQLDATGCFRGSGVEQRVADGFSAEDLVLAGLIACSIASLRHAAGRAGIEVGAATGSARGTVTRREEDGRYAFVEIAVEISAALAPTPDEGTRAELVERAERGCFVGASLTAKPVYSWSLV
jgi:uncharacterized OsmC-like protein